MNSIQYEEMCRYFLAQKIGIGLDQILSLRIPNPKRDNLPQYKHQIDLYWESHNELCDYLHIANAKWRGSDKVDQGEILLLQQVKQKVTAHKAMMITNSEFTSGAIAVAKDEGIALHIIRPIFDVSLLHRKNRVFIQNKIIEIVQSSGNEPIYEHLLIHKAFEFSENKPVVNSNTNNIRFSTKIVANYTTKVVSEGLNKSISSGKTQPNLFKGTVTKDVGGFNKK